MPDKKTLDYYVSELRRIEKSRQADSEKEIKKIYRELKKDLNSFLANEYADFSNGNGVLTVGMLQEKARYAKFLQEVDEHLNSITPEISKTIQSTVKKTYKAVYEGMIDAVTTSVDSDELKTKLKELSIRPEVMNRAINNPISGLTLPDTLEKHRKEVIYNIKQQINTGLMTGERFDTMAKNINKVLSGTDGTGGLYAKAMNIVRTEVHRVQESGLNDCAKDISSGLDGSGLIYAATWRNMGDQRVRPNVRVHTAKGWKTYKAHTTANHEKLEGMTIRVGDKFEIEPGVFAECPGSSGTARNDCNCRCFLEYSLMNVEEFAKATGKSVEEVEKNILKKSSRNGIINKQGKTVEDIKTFRGLEKYFSSKYSITTSDDVKKLEFSRVKNSLKGVEQIFTEYPELSKLVKSIEITNSGVMSCSGNKIKFNPAYYDKHSKSLQKLCEDMSKIKHWVNNASPESLGVHEAAHGIEYLLIETNSSYTYAVERTLAWNDCTEAKIIVNEAIKEIRKTSYGKGKRKAELISSISDYASTNASETMAEAFADVFANGSKANPLSIEIKKITKKRYNMYKGVI